MIQLMANQMAIPSGVPPSPPQKETGISDLCVFAKKQIARISCVFPNLACFVYGVVGAIFYEVSNSCLVFV